ncbi:MAG: PrsW family glutamic-type intramembrane protease [Patescibacteria group bacterium]
MAALIGAYSGYVALAFLPPLAWLLFYLHEDRHPEPKHLILITFLAGILSALFAAALELGFFAVPPVFRGLFYVIYPAFIASPVVLFGGIALIEEYLKYVAVKIAVLTRPEFDEPIDAMIYMVTAALGFAAMENVLFLIPVFEQSFLSGFQLTTQRFLGANFLHTLSSAIVGYTLARHHFSPWRKHAVAVGVIIASILHTIFNYLIIIKDAIPVVLTLLILLITLMAVAVFVEFERLKKKSQIGTNNYTD